VKDVATETTINPTEIVTTVSTTIEEVISIKDSLVSNQKNNLSMGLKTGLEKPP
jgi:hypothetical protein